MITIGAFEVKTNFSTLLERVTEGEEVIITSHGKAVARLISATVSERPTIEQIIDQLKTLRTDCTLGELSWKSLKNEGL